MIDLSCTAYDSRLGIHEAVEPFTMDKISLRMCFIALEKNEFFFFLE
jgi:hypothetical protein